MGIDLTLSSKAAEKRLWIALGVSLLIVAVEVTGGVLGQSLALLGDSAHVLTDVLTVGIAILTLRLGRMRHTPRRTFGYHRAEILAGLIGLMIIRSAYGLVRDSTNILLEATPKQFELGRVAETIRSVNGVKGVHDLHVWTITSGLYALSGHVTVDSDTISQGSIVLEKVAAKLKESFGIEHVTLQMEKETLENIEHESSRL